jgi:DNA-binding MarR family transcriptional regulator
MSVVLQDSLPYEVTFPAPLPGVRPLAPAEWLIVDEAFERQMAERARLLRDRRDEVLAVTPEGRDAAAELLEHVLAWLAAHAPSYTVESHTVTRPDGLRVPLDPGDPMGTLGLLVQEDLCLMQKRGKEHVLTAAVLCFPANWRLSEKINRPLTGIHDPVEEYDSGLAKRVQRLFDGVQVDRPLWRYNALSYADPELFQPVRRRAPGPDVPEAAFRYLRSERQSILRLPRTRACVFSIHTFVLETG